MKPLVFSFLSRPGDVNDGGKTHGGMIMKWLDEAAYACASQWSGKYCRTVYAGGIQFLRPLDIGDIVEIIAKIIYTGPKSMHIACDVYSTKITGGDKIKNTHCIMVFVAMDESHTHSIPIPKWTPTTDEEKALEIYAIELMELRKVIAEKMKRFSE